ncbi:MAG TPA: class I SAM-dependent methyltransferase [Chryseosolibacter sp.]
MEPGILDKITSAAFQQFIRANENADVNTLVLKQQSVLDVPAAIVAEQISGRKKAKEKFPTFYNSTTIYPRSLNLEQSSSEQTATFKAKIFLQTLPVCKSLIDLTGGFGVDSFFLSKVFKAVHYLEPDGELFEIVSRNHNYLGARNITHHNIRAEVFLAEEQEASAFFIDPSRRLEEKKVFRFSDCQPNVVSLKNNIFAAADYLMVKAAPLLDLKLGIEELGNVTKVFVVSVDNEVKELLLLCKNHFSGEASIEAVNLLRSSSEVFSFNFSEEEMTKSDFSDPASYLYEPNASILKAGAFKSIGKNFGLNKIQANTHFYTADILVNEFPGRIFKIVSEVKPEKKVVARFFPDGKANVIARNYPLSPVELKKKTALNDGGNRYLLAFAGQTKKFVLVADRIK